MSNILIVEDDANIRQLLKLTLKSYNYTLIDFGDGSEAYQYLKEHHIDLAILDLMLPGMDGLDILKYIRSTKRLAKTPVIILSAKDKELDKIVGLDTGADDYMTKPFSVLELAARIRSLLRRTQKNESIYTVEDMVMDVERRSVQIGDKNIELTYKEFELLKYFIQNSYRAISRDELLNQIWGYDYVGETRTLDVHVNSLRKKLNKDWIQTVRQVGYQFVAGEKEDA